MLGKSVFWPGPLARGINGYHCAVTIFVVLYQWSGCGDVHAASYDCLIEPTQTIEIASPVVGLLDRVYVKRGDRVTKGMIVAQLDSKTEQAAVDMARFKSEQLGPVQMAERKIEFAQRKYQRRRDMASERLMAPQERDDAEADMKQAEAELQVARENRDIAKIELQQQGGLLNLRTMRSPFSGVVVEQLAYPGEVVEPGSDKKAILRLAQLDPLRIHVILPKSDFGLPAVGMPVAVIPEIPPGSKYEAKVKSIDRLIDAASGTFVVLLEMSNAKFEIPAGVKCRAEFPWSSSGVGRPATMVPNASGSRR